MHKIPDHIENIKNKKLTMNKSISSLVNSFKSIVILDEQNDVQLQVYTYTNGNALTSVFRVVKYNEEEIEYIEEFYLKNEALKIYNKTKEKI